MTATIINMEDSSFHGKSSIADDFSYNNNVANANTYIRMGFLRKVYGILSVQLILTTITACVFKFTPIIRSYITVNQWPLVVCFISSLVLLLALHVKRRETPTNYVLLTIFTLVQSYTVGTVVTYYDEMIVLQAFLLTAAVTIGLTVYTLQSKRDFSKLGAGLFAALWILIIGTFVQAFIGSTSFEILLSGAGALIFSLFIVYDTHMIMHRISAEEYIIATIELYLDIINLFLELLRLLDAVRKN